MSLLINFKDAERVQRLETSGGYFSENLGPMGTQGGPIRLGMESAAGSFRQLEATAGSDGGRRIFRQLDQLEGLCLSPIQHDVWPKSGRKQPT